MKKINNFIYRVASVLAFASLPTLAFSQKAGDVISGIVEDSEGPVMMANVVEMDETGRIVAHAVTDINGEFSFRLQNPKNKLTITYVGYETVELPFDKTYFKIMMSDVTEIQEVVIKAEIKAGGLGSYDGQSCVAVVEEIIFRRLLIDAIDDSTMLSDSMVILVGGLVGTIADFAWMMSIETVVTSLIINLVMTGIYVNSNRSLGLNVIRSHRTRFIV